MTVSTDHGSRIVETKPQYLLWAFSFVVVSLSGFLLLFGTDAPESHWPGWFLAAAGFGLALAYRKSTIERSFTRTYAAGPGSLTIWFIPGLGAVVLVLIHAWYLAKWLGV